MRRKIIDEKKGLYMGGYIGIVVEKCKRIKAQ
jgi:hypothetical protein